MDQQNTSAGDGVVTASTTQTGPAVPEDRVSAAMSACFEIEQVASALQDLIDARDTCGMVYPVSRGILMRIAALADHIHSCLDDETDDKRFADVRSGIYGVRGVL